MEKAQLLSRTAQAQQRIRDAALRMTQDIELHERITRVTARGPVGACLTLEAVAAALEALSPVPVPVVEVVEEPQETTEQEQQEFPADTVETPADSTEAVAAEPASDPEPQPEAQDTRPKPKRR